MVARSGQPGHRVVPKVVDLREARVRSLHRLVERWGIEGRRNVEAREAAGAALELLEEVERDLEARPPVQEPAPRVGAW